MIDYKDFKNADGTTDWKAYDQAKINAGEKCYKCGSFVYPAKGYKTVCYDCKELEENKEEVTHDSLIRCPYCRHSWNVSDNENYECFEDGSHTLQCPKCDTEFEITTTIEYSFTSPELIDIKDDDGGEIVDEEAD